MKIGINKNSRHWYQSWRRQHTVSSISEGVVWVTLAREKHLWGTGIWFEICLLRRKCKSTANAKTLGKKMTDTLKTTKQNNNEKRLDMSECREWETAWEAHSGRTGNWSLNHTLVDRPRDPKRTRLKVRFWFRIHPCYSRLLASFITLDCKN